MLTHETLSEIDGRAKLFAVDFHDDPVSQNATLSIEADPAWLEETLDQKRRNLVAFRWYIVPSIELAELAGLDLDRTIVAGNGSDTTVIRPMPWPDQPAIGYMSGAAAGRGIETLIEAARLVRSAVPDLRLLLWLAATGPVSDAYLADLRRATAKDDWIEFAAVPYREIGVQLGRATVQCIPNPPSAYWDAVSPIKLFDSMASGRPVVVTRRTAMRSDVERHNAGLVAQGESAEDIAAAIVVLIQDESLARRLGANGRGAAVEAHDWSLISGRLTARLVELET
jgi:glycosyltransferase involved in cell wall biosynthesis